MRIVPRDLVMEWEKRGVVPEVRYIHSAQHDNPAIVLSHDGQTLIVEFEADQEVGAEAFKEQRPPA